jgi:hypothetical protein
MVILQRVNKIRVSSGNRENYVFDTKRKGSSANRIKDPKYF